jgi:DNA-binding FadR family transcriptional regulator
MAVKKESGSVVRRAAEELRRTIITRPDGEFLGSESDLVARLGISRPTFRQAAKLVEQEQLLVIKRGVGGGFFARQPSTTAVAHVAAVYLHARKATIEDAIRSAKPIFAEIARAAAKRADPATYANLASFLAQERNAPTDIRAFLRAERDFLTIFAAASGNPVLELYALVLMDFAATFVADSVFSRNADRVPAYRAIRTQLIQAILGGDEEVATVLSHRRSDMIISWMESDMAVAKSGGSPKRVKQAARQLIQPPAQGNGAVVEDGEASV